MTTSAEIVSAASAAIFGRPLVTNIYRSVIVEAIVATALPEWEWCSSDYAPYDFTRNNIRLEVKQSAIRQTWSTARFSRPSWDIAPKTGYWLNGITWVPAPGRNADLYVLALHSITDERADHRDPSQWLFYVAPAACLPETKRIGLRAVEKLASAVSVQQLSTRVEEIVALIKKIANLHD
ncbi:MAG TPA: hypothetical protein VHC00_05875 [Rhizobiaceae bacterium]|nr:hypothetical protein [Rhizobiaceae bacterium]